MAYSETVLRRARARLEQAQMEREAEYEAHRAAAYEKYPRLQEIEHEMMLTVSQAVSTAFRKNEDPKDAILALRNRNMELQREREWIMDAAGFDEGYLDSAPVCERCGGSGYVGGAMCSCLRELCRQEQKKN